MSVWFSSQTQPPKPGRFVFVKVGIDGLFVVLADEHGLPKMHITRRHELLKMRKVPNNEGVFYFEMDASGAIAQRDTQATHWQYAEPMRDDITALCHRCNWLHDALLKAVAKLHSAGVQGLINDKCGNNE